MSFPPFFIFIIGGKSLKIIVLNFQKYYFQTLVLRTIRNINNVTWRGWCNIKYKNMSQFVYNRQCTDEYIEWNKYGFTRRQLEIPLKQRKTVRQSKIIKISIHICLFHILIRCIICRTRVLFCLFIVSSYGASCFVKFSAHIWCCMNFDIILTKRSTCASFSSVISSPLVSSLSSLLLESLVFRGDDILSAKYSPIYSGCCRVIYDYGTSV